MTVVDRRKAGGRVAPGSGAPREAAAVRAARLRRRTRLLAWGLPFVLVALAVALKLLAMSAAAQQAVWGFDAKDGAAVSGAADWMGAVDLVETHKSQFARGDALVLAGDFAGARAAFEEALRRTGPEDECTVRVNLVLSIEKLGDAARGGGDAASADRLYADAAAVVTQAPEGCFAPDSRQNQQQQGDRLGEARDRLEGKRAQVQDGGQGQQPAPGQTGPSAEPSRTPEQQAQDSRAEALQRSSESGEQERAEGEQRRDYLEDPPTAPVDRPW